MDHSKSKTEAKKARDAKAPKNVSAHLWEKFKALEKRTDEVTQMSTQKRIKHLQKGVIETVAQEFTSEHDKEVLRKHNVTLEIPMEQSFERKRKSEKEISSPSKMTTSESEEKKELESLLHVNDHLCQSDHSRPPPPTALEKRMNEAIKRGDLATAESLSDRLSIREVGEKIVSAIDAKRYLEEKKVEEESARAKRKRKLSWGFESKQRWETKGNM